MVKRVPTAALLAVTVVGLLALIVAASRNAGPIALPGIGADDPAHSVSEGQYDDIRLGASYDDVVRVMGRKEDFLMVETGVRPQFDHFDAAWAHYGSGPAIYRDDIDENDPPFINVIFKRDGMTVIEKSFFTGDWEDLVMESIRSGNLWVRIDSREEIEEFAPWPDADTSNERTPLNGGVE